MIDKKTKIDLQDSNIILLFIITVFIILFIAQGLYFLSLDKVYQFSDYNILRAFEYYSFFNAGAEPARIRDIPFPPVVFIVSQPFFSGPGFSMESARLSILVFGIVFIPAMFGIGKYYGNVWSGIGVAALALCSSYVINNSRIYLLDFPLTAMTALGFYALLKTESYGSTIWSVIAGAVLALALLTKWAAAFFLVLPVFWLLLPALKDKKVRYIGFFFLIIWLPSLAGLVFLFKNQLPPDTMPSGFSLYFSLVLLPAVVSTFFAFRIMKILDKDGQPADSNIRRLINFSYMISMLVLFASPWYLWALESIKCKLQFDLGTKPVLWENFYVYFRVLLTLFPLMPVFTIMGMVMGFKKQNDNRFRILLLLLSSIVPFLFLCFTAPLPHARYFLPAVVYLAALGGFWIARVRWGPAVAIPLSLFMVFVLFSSFIRPPGSLFYRGEGLFSKNKTPGRYRIILPVRPDGNEMSISKVFQNIMPEGSFLLTYYNPDNSGLPRSWINESFQLEILKNRIKAHEITELPLVEMKNEIDKNPRMLERIKRVNQVMILLDNKADNGNAIDILNEIYPDTARIRRFAIDSRFHVYIMDVKPLPSP